MMKYKLKSLLIMTVLMVSVWMLCSCKKSDKAEGITKTEEDKPEPKPDVATVRAMLVDKTATDETAALFYNMKTIAKTKIMFGHQDDSRSGFSWSEVPGRSDVKEVTGAYPAVYGADFLFLTSFEWNPWYDDQKVKLYDTAIEVYKRGGISVFSWHYNNPVSQGSFYWDSSPVEAVTQILPGGNYNEVYNASLKRIADFANSLVVDGKQVPFIFRPFHETDGAWFWWGATRCSDQDYKELYQYTVTYLRDVLHVHNILYGWTPGGSDNESQLLRRYPGDDYVDLIGNDDYFESAPEKEAAKLKILSDYAKSKNKLAALTETGLANVTQHNWYTQVLLKALKTNKVELAYVSAWGNTQYGFFTPYKGFNQVAEDDFVQFKNDQYLMFGDKMPNVYKIK